MIDEPPLNLKEEGYYSRSTYVLGRPDDQRKEKVCVIAFNVGGANIRIFILCFSVGPKK